MQTCWVVVDNADVSIRDGSGITPIVPVTLTTPQPPVKVMVEVYGEAAVTDGEPVMVTEFADQLPVTPVGSPVIVAAVAPVVE